MKKIQYFIGLLALLLLVFSAIHSLKNVSAKTNNHTATIKHMTENDTGAHTVAKGETLLDIAIHYGVSVEDIMETNDLQSKRLRKGEVLAIPKPMAAEDKELMARLVHAEAKGEPYEGKMAVATVVLNRLNSPDFPDTVKEVIYAKGQFCPVRNGSINQAADRDSVKAVNEAIATYGDDSLEATFFYNPKTAGDSWIKTLKVVDKIGNHNFSIS
ncbi:MAG: cell wall hydrolase [Bacillus sp. (in: firmicutes)]